MYQWILLLTGSILYICHGAAADISYGTQQAIFLGATLLLGVPHGAADLLVAKKNALHESRGFSIWRFFYEYLGAMLIFGLIFYFFPLIANLIFILLAAYHFGESDVSWYRVKGFSGILFAVTYGLFIIGAIILPHWAEVRTMIGLIATKPAQQNALALIEKYSRSIMIAISLCMILASSYSLFQSKADLRKALLFWIGTIGMLLIVTQLPMLLGFTSYFVFWHSLRSMHHIITYLKKSKSATLDRILLQMALYSLLAIAGIIIFGIFSYGYADSRWLPIYIFLGLALLTAPHMRIMHHMHTVEHDASVLNN